MSEIPASESEQLPVAPLSESPTTPSPPRVASDADSDAAAADLPRHRETPSGTFRLAWLLTLGLLMFATTWCVPQLVEQIEYARERGRQKAQVDVATVALKGEQLPLQELSKAYQLVSQRVGPSVVHINVTDEDSETKSDGRDRSGINQRRSDGQGSGVIVDLDGHLLTNRHVVHAAKKIDVLLSDGRRVPARIVGEDHLTDLAVLKVNADRLVVAEWADSEATEVGALVWAIGSPFGLERSITFGILSAKHRSGHAGTMFQDLMQTDAAVNPGNSGGPLVDAVGRVIGINTAIVGPSYQGISFAIPSNVARDVYQRLKSDGRVTRAWLGVELDKVPADEISRLNLKSNAGAYVRRLADERLGFESPARLAGILAGDIITTWNGAAVESPSALIGLIAKTTIGTKAQVMLLRDGVEKMLEVVVAARPDQLN